jgi:hypothetical protein
MGLVCETVGWRFGKRRVDAGLEVERQQLTGGSAFGYHGLGLKHISGREA